MQATALYTNNSLESPSLGGDVVGVVLGPVEEEDMATKWSPRGPESMRLLLEPSQGLGSRRSPNLSVKIGPEAEAKPEDGRRPGEGAKAELGVSLKERDSHVIGADLESKRVMESVDLGPRIAGVPDLENESARILPHSRLTAVRSARSLTASQTRLQWPVQ